MFVSDFTATKKVTRKGGHYFIFLLPGLEKKFVSDFAVVNKVMRKGCSFFYGVANRTAKLSNESQWLARHFVSEAAHRVTL